MKIKKLDYVNTYGPTKGDKVRLGDTDLWAEVEHDYTIYGEELKFGAGKTIREGMGQSNSHDENTLDLVITNALIIDYTGIYKADIGIKNGKIAGIGKAGNKDMQDGVSPNLVVGVGTEALAGEGMIVTAGGIDSHTHFLSPQQFPTALANGVTTMFGGGTGPVDGTNATTITPGEWNIHRMLRAAEEYAMNVGFLGKGNSSSKTQLVEQIEAGVVGFKLHEDWGTTPSAIDTCLSVADEYDVQVCIHTDTVNEAGYVEDTLNAMNGRAIHAYHIEGAGGGHSPDVITMAGEENILPSSTTPTIPYTINTVAEHLDMLMTCHHLDKKIREDLQFSQSRIRPGSIAAEDVLHDNGMIAMTSSDSQAMGRAGEVVPRTWQTADKNKKEFGPLKEDAQNGNDNFRIKRYISKYTINPAITHGVSEYIGSVEAGKIADLVVWNPAFFGVKPKIIIKGGLVVFSEMGDSNASVPTPQPVYYREMFGHHGKAKFDTSITFVNKLAYEKGIKEKLGLERQVLPIKNVRNITKKDFKFNNTTGKLTVDPKTFEVFLDGKLCTSKPASELPLAQRYTFF